MFPPEFFNGDAASRTRGIKFNGSDEAASGGKGATGFQLSSTAASGQPIEFGFVESFQAFSPERLFAPTGGTVFDVLFFDPVDQKTPSETDGFGAVFTNVVANDSIHMSFDDQNNVLLVQENVPDFDAGGLSFLGASFETAFCPRSPFLRGCLQPEARLRTAKTSLLWMPAFLANPLELRRSRPQCFCTLSAFVPLFVRKRRNIKTV